MLNAQLLRSHGHPALTSQQEMVWWTKSNFLGLLPKRLRTNKIVRSVTIKYHFPYNSKVCSSPLEYPYFFEWVFRKTLLGYTAAKAFASHPRSSPDRSSSWEGRLLGWDYLSLLFRCPILCSGCGQALCSRPHSLIIQPTYTLDSPCSSDSCHKGSLLPYSQRLYPKTATQVDSLGEEGRIHLFNLKTLITYLHSQITHVHSQVHSQITHSQAHSQITHSQAHS